MRSINKRDLIKHQLISFGLSSIVTVSDWVAKYPFFLWRAEYLIKMFCTFNLLSSIEIPHLFVTTKNKVGGCGNIFCLWVASLFS